MLKPIVSLTVQNGMLRENYTVDRDTGSGDIFLSNCLDVDGGGPTDMMHIAPQALGPIATIFATLGHTPGPPPHTPWTMHEAGIPYIICGPNGPSFGPVARAGTQAEALAIATLMHAAPELLAALKAVLTVWHDATATRHDDAAAEAAALAAIAKAEGAP